MKGFNLRQLNETELREQLSQNPAALCASLNNLPYLRYDGITNYIRCFEVCDKFNLKKARILLEVRLATLVEKSNKEGGFYQKVLYYPAYVVPSSTPDLFRQKFLALLAMANFDDKSLMRSMLSSAAYFLKDNLKYQVHTQVCDALFDGFIENIVKYLSVENENFDNMIFFIRDNFLFFNQGFSSRAAYATRAVINSGIIISILKHFSVEQFEKAFAFFEKHDSFKLSVDAAFLDESWLVFVNKERGFEEVKDKLPKKFQEFYCFKRDIESCQDEAQKDKIYHEKRGILIAATNSISRANRILSIEKLSIENKNDFLKNILAKIGIENAEDFTDFIKPLAASQCELLCQKLAKDKKFAKTLYLKNYSPEPSFEGFCTVMNALATPELLAAQEIAYEALESGLLKLFQEVKSNDYNPIYNKTGLTLSEGFEKVDPLYPGIQTVNQCGDYIFKPLSPSLRIRAYEKLKLHLVKLFDARDKISTNHVIFYICIHFLPQEKTQEICEFFKNNSVAIGKFQLMDFASHMRRLQPEKIPAICNVFVRALINNAADFKTILPFQKPDVVKSLLNELKDKINEKIQNLKDLEAIVDCVDNKVHVDAKNIICTLLHARMGQLINGSSHINWLFKDLNDGVKALVIDALKPAVEQFKENLKGEIEKDLWFPSFRHSDLKKFLYSFEIKDITSKILYEFFTYMDGEEFLQKKWQDASVPKSATRKVVLDFKPMQSNAAPKPIYSLNVEKSFVNGL